MPLYDFRCLSCGKEYEEITSYDSIDRVQCPACNDTKKERIFKVTVKGPVAGCGPANSGFT
ncbi:FmdB family zinc ribbon protein [Numidum massiliense]|uniref:FmdB family zinc ribbon protein n=1 Tax=Numidum massiliense TaxID=1522315 RepID=UPI0006D57D9A|nr:zinc ribbon domain-containing protein [Numidum massiliense]